MKGKLIVLGVELGTVIDAPALGSYYRQFLQHRLSSLLASVSRRDNRLSISPWSLELDELHFDMDTSLPSFPHNSRSLAALLLQPTLGGLHAAER